MQESKILIVDDLPENIELIRNFFYDQSYKIYAAHNGKEAIRKAKKIHPDLILLDIIMPGMDGFEVTKELKKNTSTQEIPIILITGLQDSQSKQKGYNLGVDDFITKPINMYELKTRCKSLINYKKLSERLNEAEQILYYIALMVEQKEQYRQGHTNRLAKYSELLARSLGLSGEEIKAIRVGGILHDIGKISIGDKILNKPGPLDSEEFEEIKRHPVEGEKLCQPFANFINALPLIKYHQERYDGSGYPEGLEGDHIPLGARIVALVESYTSLTTPRPFRDAYSRGEALDILDDEVKKGKWDTKIFSEFKKMLSEKNIEQKVNTTVNELRQFTSPPSNMPH